MYMQHMAYICAYRECFIVDGVQSSLLDLGLPLRGLALIREEVGLDVGVREAIAVGRCQSLGFLDPHMQCLVCVLHTKQDLSGDFVVLFLPSLGDGLQV